MRALADQIIPDGYYELRRYSSRPNARASFIGDTTCYERTDIARHPRLASVHVHTLPTAR